MKPLSSKCVENSGDSGIAEGHSQTGLNGPDPTPVMQVPWQGEEGQGPGATSRSSLLGSERGWPRRALQIYRFVVKFLLKLILNLI